MNGSMKCYLWNRNKMGFVKIFRWDFNGFHAGTSINSVSWLTRLYPVLSPRKPWFNPTPAHVWLILIRQNSEGQGYLQVFRFSSFSIIPTMFHIHSFIHSFIHHVSRAIYTLIPRYSRVRSSRGRPKNQNTPLGTFNGKEYQNCPTTRTDLRATVYDAQGKKAATHITMLLQKKETQ